jgi:hypothetical protein
MKKIFLALAVISILAFAGSAFAQGGWRHGGGFGKSDDLRQERAWGGHGGFEGRGRQNLDLPQEIRDKLAQAEKIGDELRSELGQTPINKDRALALYRQHRDIKNEVGEWFFLQRLEKAGREGN